MNPGGTRALLAVLALAAVLIASVLVITTGEPPVPANPLAGAGHDSPSTGESPMAPPAGEPAAAEAHRIAAGEVGLAFGTITGRIVEATGVPVARTRVQLLTVPAQTIDPTLGWLFDRGGRTFWRPHPPTTTDDTGRYVLPGVNPECRFMLRIDPTGPRAAIFSDLPQRGVDGVADHGLLVLPQRSEFRGLVVDPAGRPLRDARIRLVPFFYFPWEAGLSDLPNLAWITEGAATYADQAEPAASVRWTVVPPPRALTDSLNLVPTLLTRTDARGRFELVAAPGLHGSLVVDHPHFPRKIVPFETSSPDLGLGGGEISLDSPCRLAGKVVDLAGKPVPGLVVGAGTTDSEGIGFAYRWTTTAPDGSFELIALFAAPAYLFLRRDNDFDWTVDGPFDPDTDRPVIRFRPGKNLTLSAVTPEAHPIPGAEFALRHADAKQTEFEAALSPLPPVLAESGTIRVTGLQPRDYRVITRAPGYLMAEGLARMDREEVLLTLRPVEALPLLVRVVDARTGAPVPEAGVFAGMADTRSSLETGFLVGNADHVVVDERGEGTLERVGRGLFRLRVTHPDYATAQREVAVSQGEIDLLLSRGGGVRGRLSFRGRPLPGRRVVLRPVHQEEWGLPRVRICLTAADGSFGFEALPAQAYALDLRLAEGYVTASDQPLGALLDTEPDATRVITVTNGAVTEESADLAADISSDRVLVRGTLQQAGRPLAGRLVQAWEYEPDEGWAAATLSNADGSFLLGIHSPRPVHVIVDSVGYRGLFTSAEQEAGIVIDVPGE